MSLNCQLKNCTQCRLSSLETVTAPLAGQGRENSQYMLLTFAPTSAEDDCRKHFPGDEGILLEAMLNSVGLALREFYTTTYIKCKVPYGVTVSKEEVATCTASHFATEIATIKPTAILAMGSDIGKALYGQQFSITKQRGVFLWEDIPLMITYHPRYLLRFPSLEAGSPKWGAWEDLKTYKDLTINGIPF